MRNIEKENGECESSFAKGKESSNQRCTKYTRVDCDKKDAFFLADALTSDQEKMDTSCSPSECN